jgi:HEPN domain-containing protein
VTNQERGNKLLASAMELEMELKRGSWNLAVRRAQEVVELALKGLINLMGVEYPRTHDVSPVLAELLPQHLPDVPQTVVAEIQHISRTLTRKRAPAFYFEQDESETTAREAAASAHKVLQWSIEWQKRLVAPEPPSRRHQI